MMMRIEKSSQVAPGWASFKPFNAKDLEGITKKIPDAAIQLWKRMSSGGSFFCWTPILVTR